jgi:hypothetical protein
MNTMTPDEQSKRLGGPIALLKAQATVASSDFSLLSSYTYQIFLKSLSGTTAVYDAVIGSTVSSVKTWIRDTSGIPCHLQRLIYAGRELEEGLRTLASYGIQHGSTLELMLRLLGGAPKRKLPSVDSTSDEEDSSAATDSANEGDDEVTKRGVIGRKTWQEKQHMKYPCVPCKFATNKWKYTRHCKSPRHLEKLRKAEVTSDDDESDNDYSDENFLLSGVLYCHVRTY